jgi:hypothetical protein
MGEHVDLLCRESPCVEADIIEAAREEHVVALDGCALADKDSVCKKCKESAPLRNDSAVDKQAD